MSHNNLFIGFQNYVPKLFILVCLGVFFTGGLAASAKAQDSNMITSFNFLVDRLRAFASEERRSFNVLFSATTAGNI